MAGQTTENVVGAVIFFSYIVAALFFTGLIGRDLILLSGESYAVKRDSGSVHARQQKRKQRAQVFLALSALSFSVLSYHMLSFLITSFSTWRRPSWRLAAETVLGNDDLLAQGPRQLILYIWKWSKQSTLFKDFAEDLVRDSHHFCWTTQALVYSLAWNIYMAVEGTKRQIPHLWAYFILDQILPISFTQNLFCTAVFLIGDQTRSRSLTAAAPGDQFVLVFAYLLSLSVVDRYIGSALFFVLLVAIRALLFAPYFMMRPQLGPVKASGATPQNQLFWRYRYSASVLAVGGIALVVAKLMQEASAVDVVRAIGENSAVAALAYDYIIGLISSAIFASSRGPPALAN